MRDRRNSPALSPSTQFSHLPILRPRSSRLSLQSSSSAPRTPRSSCGSPSIYFQSAANRNSSDSWSSSINLDEPEFEWKPEHIRLLSRTLDALPSHLVTPFVGAVPPPNLLDKIARGVCSAKNASDWPHSVRATRIKLLGLAKAQAKEDALAEKRRDSIAEEECADDQGDLVEGPKNVGSGTTHRKRPLYRQSSMDFVSVDDHDRSNIDRLSNRFESNERTFPNPAYLSYSRALRPKNRGLTPPPTRLLNTATPSSSTLNSSYTSTTASSTSSQGGTRRRSASTLVTSDDNLPVGCDSESHSAPSCGQVQRLRSGSVTMTPSSNRPFKRAPTFGALAQDARQQSMVVDGVEIPSSDEEEKQRKRHIKKARTKSPPDTPVDLDAKFSPLPKTVRKSKPTGVVDKPANTKKRSGPPPILVRTENSPSPRRYPKQNPQRNPSMFGGELPQLPPSPVREPTTCSPVICTSPVSPISPLLPRTQTSSPVSPPTSPTSPQMRQLRRVRRFDLAPGRRISFGQAAAGPEEQVQDSHCARGGLNLGSAFQLI